MLSWISRQKTREDMDPRKFAGSAMEIRMKLEKVILKQELLKSSFLELTSDVRTGLLQARSALSDAHCSWIHFFKFVPIANQSSRGFNFSLIILQAQEVFNSLAIPLTKLVGLKTTEMAQEGRFSNIVIDPNQSQEHLSDRLSGMDSPSILPSIVQDDDIVCHNPNLAVENYTAKAAVAGRKFLENQHKQLGQLVRLLRTMGGEVNSSHDDVIQCINDRRLSLRTFFRKSVAYLSDLNASNQDVFPATLKIFQATCHAVNMVLNSVESGLEDLMQSLSQQMHDPLVQHVHALKSDLKDGPCAQLMNVVDDIGKAIIVERAELRKVKKDLKSAEEAKIVALRRLTDSEERTRKIKESVDVLLHGNKITREAKSVASFANEFWCMVENEAMNGQQIWDLWKKRSRQVPESPHGPEELFIMPNERHHKANGTRVRHSISHTSLVRNHIASPRTPRLDYMMHLGLSP